MNVDRLEEAKARRLPELAAGYGIEPKSAGGDELKFPCPHPGHEDTDPSCYINTADNLFKCHGCGWAGSAIDFVMGIEGVGIKQAINILVGEKESSGPIKKITKAMAKKKKYNPGPEYQTGQWDYRDGKGDHIYSSIRYDYPDGTKDFSMKTMKDGALQWGLKGDIQRVPLNLSQFADHQEVWFTEGEKCSDALMELGFFASNIAGGSGAKLEGVSNFFRGMDVILLPDNDDSGRGFMKTFAIELQGVAKSVRMLDVGTPRNSKGYDIFDKIKDMRLDEMSDPQIAERLCIMKDASLYMLDGEQVHILDHSQREAEYKLMLTLDGFDLGDFIPALKGVVRPFVRGDCLGIVGGTGSGKTAMLQAISEWTAPMTVLNFNLELSTGVFYEREASSISGIPAKEVESRYNDGNPVDTRDGLRHIYTVSVSRVTPNEIRKQFWLFVKLTGLWPEWTVIDYVQLLKGTGQRYERTTDNAEEIRIMGKELDTRMVFTSQKSRPPKSTGKADDSTPTLHDAKDSGGLENSMSVYMDIRPHPIHPNVKKGVVLKNTRGPAGVEFDIGWNGSCTKFVAGSIPTPDEVQHSMPYQSEPDDDVPF